jgi:hypothetical protein
MNLNYLYDPKTIEANHEAFAQDGTVVRSLDVDALLVAAAPSFRIRPPGTDPATISPGAYARNLTGDIETPPLCPLRTDFAKKPTIHRRKTDHDDEQA